MQPVFKACESYVNGTSEKMFANGLCLPSDTNMTDMEVDEAGGIIKGLIKG